MHGACPDNGYVPDFHVLHEAYSQKNSHRWIPWYRTALGQRGMKRAARRMWEERCVHRSVQHAILVLSCPRGSYSRHQIQHQSHQIGRLSVPYLGTASYGRLLPGWQSRAGLVCSTTNDRLLSAMSLKSTMCTGIRPDTPPYGGLLASEDRHKLSGC